MRLTTCYTDAQCVAQLAALDTARELILHRRLFLSAQDQAYACVLTDARWDCAGGDSEYGTHGGPACG